MVIFNKICICAVENNTWNYDVFVFAEFNRFHIFEFTYGLTFVFKAKRMLKVKI